MLSLFLRVWLLLPRQSASSPLMADAHASLRRRRSRRHCDFQRCRRCRRHLRCRCGCLAAATLTACVPAQWRRLRRGNVPDRRGCGTCTASRASLSSVFLSRFSWRFIASIWGCTGIGSARMRNRKPCAGCGLVHMQPHLPVNLAVPRGGGEPCTAATATGLTGAHKKSFLAWRAHAALILAPRQNPECSSGHHNIDTLE